MTTREDDTSIFGMTGRESAEAVFSTTAGITNADEAVSPGDTSTVEAAISDIDRASTHTQQNSGLDSQTVAAARDAVARAKQPGGSPTAAADLGNIRNAILTEKGKVDAEQVKELQQSFAVGAAGLAGGAALAAMGGPAMIGGAALSAEASAELHAIRGSLSQVFTSAGAQMAADGNKIAMGEFGKWTQHSRADLGGVQLPTVPGQGPAPAAGRYT